MRIGAVGMSPYIYNTNVVSSISMNRISAIPGDVAGQKLDYTGLVSDGNENINPLGKGKSANFLDILASQMSMSRNRQAKVMKNAVLPDEEDMSFAAEDMADEMMNPLRAQELSAAAEQPEDLAVPAPEEMSGQKESGSRMNDGKAAGQELFRTDMFRQNIPEAGMYDNNVTGAGYTQFRMNHALEAYQVSMGVA